MGAMRVNRFSRVIWLVIAVVVFAGDQVTKAVVEDLIPEHTTIPVFSHFLNLIHTKNPGAAFGLFSESPAHWKTVLLIVVSSLLLAMVMAMIWRTRQLRWGMGVALALILGGALSNLFDRIRFGRVVDFLDAHIQSCRQRHCGRSRVACVPVAFLGVTAKRKLENGNSKMRTWQSKF
jgi:signal peptidase II